LVVEGENRLAGRGNPGSKEHSLHHYHNQPSKDPSTTASGMNVDFSFAFQPIVDARKREILSFEALVRGPHGEPSASVFARVSSQNLPLFDEALRQKAIAMANTLKIPRNLSINLFPKSLYQVDLNISATFQASIESGFPVDKIIFEITESENLTDQRNLLRFLKLYQDFGFTTAIDDFGTGYSGLKLLVEYQPNYIKLDRHLIADIDTCYVRQSIVSGIRNMCERLSIEVMAEGVERFGEYQWLRSTGVNIFQGYYFARPGFESLPNVALDLYAV
jgi:EAL domain-containing protein (putative c-di-GMP-specific phosphodiesterase class I)